MKTFVFRFTLLLVVIGLPCFVYSQNHADDICGYWYTGNQESVIRIFKGDSGSYQGKFVWLKEPVERDKKSPNYGNPKIDEYTNEPIIGTLIIRHIEFNGKDRWEKGILYDPEKGKTYDCFIELTSDKNTLMLTGFMGPKLFRKTVKWERTEEPK